MLFLQAPVSVTCTTLPTRAPTSTQATQALARLPHVAAGPQLTRDAQGQRLPAATPRPETTIAATRRHKRPLATTRPPLLDPGRPRSHAPGRLCRRYRGASRECRGRGLSRRRVATRVLLRECWQVRGRCRLCRWVPSCIRCWARSVSMR